MGEEDEGWGATGGGGGGVEGDEGEGLFVSDPVNDGDNHDP